MKLAGQVAAADASPLVVLDEYGLADVTTTPGVEQPGEAELVLIEGVVDVRHGSAVLKASRVSDGWCGLIGYRFSGSRLRACCPASRDITGESRRMRRRWWCCDRRSRRDLQTLT